jgi:hypothetical protein
MIVCIFCLHLYVFQLMSGENVSTWLNFLVSGIEQVILLVMCIVFEIRKKANKNRFLQIQKDDDTQPLLVREIQ